MRVVIVLSFFMLCVLIAYIKGYNNGVIDGRIEQKWRNKDERRTAKVKQNI